MKIARLRLLGSIALVWWNTGLAYLANLLILGFLAFLLITLARVPPPVLGIAGLAIIGLGIVASLRVEKVMVGKHGLQRIDRAEDLTRMSAFSDLVDVARELFRERKLKRARLSLVRSNTIPSIVAKSLC